MCLVFAGAVREHVSGFFRRLFKGELDSVRDIFRSFIDALRNIFAEFLANHIVNSLFSKLAGEGGSGFISRLFSFGGKKATGGVATSGIYELGEDGPEYVVNARATKRYIGELERMNKGGSVFDKSGEQRPQVIVNQNFEAGVSPSQLQQALAVLQQEMETRMAKDQYRLMTSTSKVR